MHHCCDKECTLEAEYTIYYEDNLLENYTEMCEYHLHEYMQPGCTIHKINNGGIQE